MDKADEIINDYHQSIKRYKKYIRAGLCPTCEETLKIKEDKETIVQKRFLQKNIVIYKTTFSVICPNNHPLIHPKYPELGNRSFIGCMEYANTLNKEIQQYRAKWLLNY